jgi:hypothetical protein
MFLYLPYKNLLHGEISLKTWDIQSFLICNLKLYFMLYGECFDEISLVLLVFVIFCMVVGRTAS